MKTIPTTKCHRANQKNVAETFLRTSLLQRGLSESPLLQKLRDNDKECNGYLSLNSMLLGVGD